MTVASLPTGTLAEQTLGPPPAPRPFPLAQAAAKGLAALPLSSVVRYLSANSRAREKRDARQAVNKIIRSHRKCCISNGKVILA